MNTSSNSSNNSNNNVVGAKGSSTTLSAHKLQRKQRLEVLVQQRITNFNYLQKTHEGGNFWLNIVLLTSQDIQRLIAQTVPKQRVIAYYYLGLSLFRICESIRAGPAIVRALTQLVEEYEYYCSGAAMQGMKLLLAKSSSCIYPSLVVMNDSSEETLIRPSIYKFQNSIVCERLLTPHIAFELDYVEVLVALCDALGKVYSRLFQPECYANAMIYEAILRIDGRIKHHVVNTVSKELTDYCTKTVKSEANSLRASLIGRV